ncbi:DUF4097 family beta strand repeat protein [Candidatus Bathyarchaeota archaeon]|nr:DUF4097 family beta strand repeat protein [Candidatus Bathyarchaeota archaeon]
MGQSDLGYQPTIRPPWSGTRKINRWTIAIVTIGILVLGALFSLIYYSTAQISTKTFTYTPPNGSYRGLSISDVDGPVTVQIWSQSTILINGTLTAKGLGSSLSTITLTNSTSNGNLVFKATFPPSAGILFSQTFTATINVFVPASSQFENVQVTNVNGAVRLKNVNSTSVAIKTTNGNIQLDCVYCLNATAVSTNGNVTGVFATLITKGTYSLTSANDNIVFIAPSSSSFQLSATVLNGSIYCEITGCPSAADGRALTYTFNGGGSTVDLNSVNGQITLVGT